MLTGPVPCAMVLPTRGRWYSEFCGLANKSMNSPCWKHQTLMLPLKIPGRFPGSLLKI